MSCHGVFPVDGFPDVLKGRWGGGWHIGAVNAALDAAYLCKTLEVSTIQVWHAVPVKQSVSSNAETVEENGKSLRFRRSSSRLPSCLVVRLN